MKTENQQSPVITLASTDEELQGILVLQEHNLKSQLSADEQMSEGFVTLKHDLALLRLMNQPHRHVIAKLNQQVVGYALIMMPQMARHMPLLKPMFERIEQLTLHDQPITNDRYVVMGQVCVAKAYRSSGLFAGLYARLAETMKPHCDCVITEIATHNTRSVRAHEKVGFKTVSCYTSNATEWQIVLWELQT